MAWRTCSFLEAFKGMMDEFDKSPTLPALALVWRSKSEYNVMDSWLLSKIILDMEEKTLRVVLWLTRQEAATLISVLRKEE